IPLHIGNNYPHILKFPANRCRRMIQKGMPKSTSLPKAESQKIASYILLKPRLSRLSVVKNDEIHYKQRILC
ncbi:MAG: hypothetical protein K2H73_10280, partial [Treponemataceae bacterium]|nr:hypothetical protein [Treponemataceae bacterium]